MIFYEAYYEESEKKFIFIKKKDNLSTVLNDLSLGPPNWIWDKDQIWDKDWDSFWK